MLSNIDGNEWTFGCVISLLCAAYTTNIRDLGSCDEEVGVLDPEDGL